MGLRRNQFDDNTVGPEKQTKSLRQNRYFFESFMTEPFCTTKGANAAPGGTSGEAVLVHTGRYTFEYYFVGGASDGSVPVLGTDGGYDWTLDGDTAAEGVEINFGSLKAGHPRTFRPSTENFFFRVLVSAEDASGLDLFVGFRLVAAYAQTLTEYSDLFGIRILGDSSSTAGAFSVVTNLNNAGATDYTSVALAGGLEDATKVELEVRSEGRAGGFYINGVRYRTGSFTPDIGDYFTPVVRLLDSTDLAGMVKTFAAEGGLLTDRAKGTLDSMIGGTF